MPRAQGVEEQARPFLLDVDAEEVNTELRFDIDQLKLMDEAGVFSRTPRRVILLGGKLFEMAPIGSPHMDGQSNLLFALTSLVQRLGLRDRLKVGTGTLTLSNVNAPQPDAMVTIAEVDSFYVSAASARLVCEVSWSSLAADLGHMKALYAGADIPEYWVLDLQAKVLNVFREPGSGRYAFSDVLRTGDRISPLFADGRDDIAVGELF